MFVLNIIRRTYQGYLRVANVENIILITCMINNMKTCILKSILKGLFLNIIIKSKQEHHLCSPILICTELTKESNIFT